jgi:signal recognition particle receptor subunit beta
MEQNLRALGYDSRSMPLVLQCNKRDLTGDIAPASLIQQQLGLDAVRCFPAVATQGTGVFDTLKAIINLVTAHTQQQL